MSFEITYSQDTETDQRSRIFRQLDILLGFSVRTRLRLYSKLAVKLRQNAPFERTLLKQAIWREKRGAYSTARILREVVRRMRANSMSFPQACRPFIPNDEYMQLAAGEKSNDLPGAFDLICDTKTRMKRITKVLRGVSWTPLGYMAINFGFIVMLAGNVLPALATMAKENGTDSNALSILIMISRYATLPIGLILLAVLIASIILVIYSLPRLTGRVRVWLEWVPPYSTYRNVQGYLWICGYLSYLKTGVREEAALEAQIEHASPWLAERLQAVLVLMIKKSKSLPEALAESGYSFPSPDIIEDIDETWGGRADYERLLSVSKQWIDDLEEITIAQSNALKYFLTIFTLLLSGGLLILGNMAATEMKPPG